MQNREQKNKCSLQIENLLPRPSFGDVFFLSKGVIFIDYRHNSSLLHFKLF